MYLPGSVYWRKRMIYDVNILDIMGERKGGDLSYTLFQ